MVNEALSPDIRRRLFVKTKCYLRCLVYFIVLQLRALLLTSLYTYHYISNDLFAMFDIYLNHPFIILDANDSACEKKRQEAFLSSKMFIPFCKPDGSWSEIQCERFSKMCWCVDSTGKEVPGTKSRNLKTCPDFGKVRHLTL